MSRWAANNPEKYDEIIAKGVANKFGVSIETAEDWLASRVRDIVLDASSSAICDAEADYFGGLVDAAMDTMERGNP